MSYVGVKPGAVVPPNAGMVKSDGKSLQTATPNTDYLPVASPSATGNLTVGGTGARILGLMSEATRANALLFQSTTPAGNRTAVAALPPVGAVQSQFELLNDSDATDCQLGQMILNATEFTFRSSIQGTASYAPITFWNSGGEKFRIGADATGTFTFSGTAPRITGDFSNATVANRVMFQTSTANTYSYVGVMPNGSGSNAAYQLYSSSDTANASAASMVIGSGEFGFYSYKTGTGAYLPMTFYTGGAERMRIGTDGKVGIKAGTGPFSYDLNIGAPNIGLNYDSAGSGVFSLNQVASSNGEIRLNNAGFTTFYNGGSERMRLDVNGRLSVLNTLNIGSLTPSNSPLWVSKAVNSDYAAYFINESVTATAYGIYVKLETTVTNGQAFTYDQGSTQKFYVMSTGAIASTSTAITGISDGRLKENVRDLDYGLKEILALRPRRFDWKAGEGTGEKNVIGFVAQEVQPVAPDLTGLWGKDQEYMTMKTGDIVPILVKAMQELKAEFDAYKAAHP